MKVGILALQGAFHEHERMLQASSSSYSDVGGLETFFVRTPQELYHEGELLDGMVFPGGESTAMGLIGQTNGIWEALRTYVKSNRPVWGTCAGMVLLSDRVIGSTATIVGGQALIGGMDVTVCRNYFGSQVSSFEMDTPPPPPSDNMPVVENEDGTLKPFPGVFIRAPAMMQASKGLDVLGRVVATPCRQAAATLRELDERIASGVNVFKGSCVPVVDALERDEAGGCIGVKKGSMIENDVKCAEEKKSEDNSSISITLPGAAEDGAREVICAVRSGSLLCTAFHPELTGDLRWHVYYLDMVRESILGKK
uniref:Glutaminase n=1 Tax=Corethron hystrix TaxID=216773 RepID=A0A7S1BQJ8_9STRA|mmetsp:Transcript_37318/g.87048  ORF Transcript_37318/g.87048 Transcript_37318/m.87048 type:complete len:310 (+) Transcript_37318:167-1096(+)|eukprot:CAMPEP_0113309648 /NCGR_PEP_ID=MMETSP0010_2-20120614/7606_1 /TAXON_ID=216773 ORGANISM="Corethron hystrix, Strain 308" /NCGR_SAMPLE_ID=MMETSP0010_2 /ASSEMBLY_ACC=CAM_ASM_000155 /LENGTH=309 /DNA_ID=CAMNT_0000164939 /DNA_START=88 /DNA_END=1017 /DNA_ORIENTATION=- /assembly_acc=CAM_ASM_000155